MAKPRLEARAYSKARKYMNTENLDFPASLARFCGVLAPPTSAQVSYRGLRDNARIASQ